MLRAFFSRLGIYYSKRQFMLRGIEWLWDLERECGAQTPRTVIDVGANVGQTTLAVLRAFPTASVHAFEPVRSTFDLLHQAVGCDPRVRLNHQAVSDRPGLVHVQLEAASDMSHVVTGAAGGGVGVESVAAVTLDGYCEQHAIAHIDILKSDTEGHDLQVLMGARGLLDQGRIDWVFVEVTFDPQNTANSMFGPIDDWLRQHGMAVWCFYDNSYAESGRYLKFCNVLFRRRR
ncbi:MAG: FkbM family methyltransferase [Vicinamibacterales bacterium]